MADIEYLKQIGKAKDQVKTESDNPLINLLMKWSQSTVDQMKQDVPKASKSLASSIGFKFGNEDGVLTIDFTADDYWDFVNSGVDGFNQSAGAIENKFGNTYSFKSAVPGRSMIDSFMGQGKQNWLASKGVTSLTYGGETYQLVTNADYRAAAYVFARAVKRHGIKPSNFVGKSFNEETIRDLENKLIDIIVNLL